MTNIRPATRDFINAVVNPFSADQPARVPDFESLQSVCFRDQAEIATPGAGFDTPNPGQVISGVVFFTSYGWTQMKNTFCDPTADESVYHVGMIGFDAVGGPLFVTATTFYESFLSQNYDTIFGNLGGGLPNSGGALVQAHRVVANGLRILPAIEMVTDTTIPYVSYYTSGQNTATELQLWMNGSGVDIRTLVKNSPHAEVYGNSEGTSNRYDPAQKSGLFEVIQLNNWGNDAKRKDDIRMPTVAIQFSQAITIGDPMPIICHIQWWLECELRQPTPIATSPSPVDAAFDSVMIMLSSSDDIYPVVTKGHSFKNFARGLPRFARLAGEIMTNSSLVGGLAMAGGAIGERIIQKRKRKKRRKRRRRRNGPQPRRGNRNAVPSGGRKNVRNF